MTNTPEKFDFIRVKYNDIDFTVNISSIESYSFTNMTHFNDGYRISIYTKTNNGFTTHFKKAEDAMDLIKNLEEQLNLLTLTYED